MRKLLAILFTLSLFSPLFAHADDNLNKIFKIEVYEYEELTNTYNLEQYGSAIYVEDDVVYTNAHVVLDSDDEPIGNYRVCQTFDFKDKPQCLTVGKLLYYDTKNDLAALKITGVAAEVVDKSYVDPEIGDVVKVYGYPYNGGDTITYTEGKVSGYEDGLYKIDANIDAGNSGGGVFDLDGNLIGMAVSVKIGYTTMGYIIPMSKIDDFQNKKNENSIKYYNENVNLDFFKYHTILKESIGKTSLSHPDFEVSGLSKYDFEIENYYGDVGKEYYLLSINYDNSETNMYLNNIRYIGETDMDFDDIYEDALEWETEGKESEDEGLYKVRKLELKGKNTLLKFNKDVDGFIFLELTIETEKNYYHEITIYSDNIKNESFLSSVKIALSDIELKEQDGVESPERLSFDGLDIDKIDNFFIKKTYYGDELVFLGDDINVNTAYTSTYDSKYIKDFTYADSIQSTYDYLKDSLYMNFAGVKSTDYGNYYTYTFTLGDDSKEWGEDTESKKYVIGASFVHKKSDDEYYMTSLVFDFDNKKSKRIIDEFLDKIGNEDMVNILELGDIKIGENLVEEGEFDF